jgi:hypothetical protein
MCRRPWPRWVVVIPPAAAPFSCRLPAAAAAAATSTHTRLRGCLGRCGSGSPLVPWGCGRRRCRSGRSPAAGGRPCRTRHRPGSLSRRLGIHCCGAQCTLNERRPRYIRQRGRGLLCKWWLTMSRSVRRHVAAAAASNVWCVCVCVCCAVSRGVAGTYIGLRKGKGDVAVAWESPVCCVLCV